MSDTIFALSTVPGKSGIAVIRISGPFAFVAAERMVGNLPPRRMSALRNVTRRDGSLIDQALVLSFAKGHSFTGEDVVELHCHGSQAIIRTILSELLAMQELRSADAGEFTRQALENDCLDIAQIEGLSDLLDAETEMQRKLAMRLFQGRLGDQVTKWRQSLIDALALVTVMIDFSDEEVPGDLSQDILEILKPLREDLQSEIDGIAIAGRIREGFEVAIVGNPNAGKSTVLNYLAGRELAITSKIAGTTRDVIELSYDLDGIPVTFLDTAGIRETGDEIELAGIDLARARADSADIRVILLDDMGRAPALEQRRNDYVVQGKGDLFPDAEAKVSGLSGGGIESMLGHIKEVLSSVVVGSTTATRQRHRVAIEEALKSIDGAVIGVGLLEVEAEIVAEDLRQASHSLAQLTGRVDVEDMLEAIFSRFCIGK